MNGFGSTELSVKKNLSSTGISFKFVMIFPYSKGILKFSSMLYKI